MCFQGSQSQVADLKSATENATNTNLTLDKSNCVSEVESRGDTTFNAIRSGFQGLVDADETFAVRFTRIFNSAQISPYFIDVFEKYNALAYSARVNGRCVRGQVPWDLNQVMVHELYHHYSVPGTGKMNLSEGRAVRAENVYNRAAGRRIRCAY